MKHIHLAVHFFLIISAIALMSCGSSSARIISQNHHSPNYTVLTISSKAVTKGILDKKKNIEIHISLPDSYKEHTDHRYPVIYALHGFGESPLAMITPFERALRANGIAETIIVAVDGTNALGGSFFANSLVTGNWEDLIVEETVALIDAKFRTIAEPTARLLSGFSMGGFASWNLALKHPEVFSLAWVCCPGAWDNTGLSDTLSGWNSTYRNAYGAAYAPDPSLPFPHAQIPSLDNTDNDLIIQQQWNDGFGGIQSRLQEYSAKKERLTAVCLAYGSQDEYRWIPRGTRYIAQSMTDEGIPTTVREFSSGHRLTNAMIADSFIPFVREHLIVDHKNK